jgi:hypothetical protein
MRWLKICSTAACWDSNLIIVRIPKCSLCCATLIPSGLAEGNELMVEQRVDFSHIVGVTHSVPLMP